MAFGESSHVKDTDGSWFSIPYHGAGYDDQVRVFVPKHAEAGEATRVSVYWPGAAGLPVLHGWLQAVFALADEDLTCRYEIWVKGPNFSEAEERPSGVYDSESYQHIERDLGQWASRGVVTLNVTSRISSVLYYHVWADLVGRGGVGPEAEVGIQVRVDDLLSSAGRSVISYLIKYTMLVRPSNSSVEDLLDMLRSKVTCALGTKSATRSMA